MYVPREDSSGAGRQVSSVENCSADMNPRNVRDSINTMKPQLQVGAEATVERSLVLNPTLMRSTISFSSKTTFILQLQAQYPS